MELNGKTIANKYIIIEELNRGSFSSIFYGINKNNKKEVAIKFELNNNTFSTIKHEVTILKYLFNHKLRNIPTVFWFGPYENRLCLIMTKYDCSLHDYINNKTLTLSKIKSIMIQIIMLIQSVHDLFLVHRDIKPQNIMIYKGELYLIDFGFSIFYIDENKNHLIDEKSQDCIIGSTRFMSYFIYEGYKPYRRDDLISISYIFLVLLCKELPWDNIQQSENNENEISIYSNRNQAIKEVKNVESIETLCLNYNIDIFPFFSYLYKLSYFEDPNYLFLIDVIKKYSDQS